MFIESYLIFYERIAYYHGLIVSKGACDWFNYSLDQQDFTQFSATTESSIARYSTLTKSIGFIKFVRLIKANYYNLYR